MRGRGLYLIFVVCVCSGGVQVLVHVHEGESLVATYLRTGIAKLSTLRDKLDTS